MTVPESQNDLPCLLSEVLTNRKALGLSDRIPCLTPYLAPLPADSQQAPSEPE